MTALEIVHRGVHSAQSPDPACAWCMREMYRDRAIGAAADFYRVSRARIAGRERVQHVATARHVAIWLTHRALPDLGFPALALLFGRTHPMAKRSCGNVERLMRKSAMARKQIEALLVRVSLDAATGRREEAA